MMRWKLEPLYVSSLPDLPMPFSPVHSARKFSTVLGTVLPNRPITMRPAGTASGSGGLQGREAAGIPPTEATRRALADAAAGGAAAVLRRSPSSLPSISMSKYTCAGGHGAGLSVTVAA
jgi:hypothetical protein